MMVHVLLLAKAFRNYFKAKLFFYRCPFVPLIKTDKALGWVSLWVVWIIKQVTTLCRLAGRVGQMGRERRLHM